MSTFNKVVTVILLLLFFVLLPVIAAIPTELLNMVRDSALSLQSFLSTAGQLVTAAVAVLLWVLVIILLYLEFRPSRANTVKVAAVEGGEASVQSSSVERRLEQSLSVLPSVQQAQAQVRQAKGGVAATVNLVTDADVNVPAVTASAIAQARNVLETEVGARVSGIDVRVRHAAGRRGAPSVAQPRVDAGTAVTAAAPVVASASARPIAGAVTAPTISPSSPEPAAWAVDRSTPAPASWSQPQSTPAPEEWSTSAADRALEETAAEPIAAMEEWEPLPPAADEAASAGPCDAEESGTEESGSTPV